MQIRPVVFRAPLSAVVLIAAFAVCDDPTGPVESPPIPVAPGPLFNASPGSATVMAAGDIARCGTTNTNDEKTADLIEAVPGATVLTLGDHTFVPAGGSVTAADYTNCYGPSWGQADILNRTHPAAGDKDWSTTQGTEYFDYFNGKGVETGERGKGYHSFDVGDWHVVALNSSIPMDTESEQYKWLKSDLAASANQCTIAYWHLPRFYSQGNTIRNGPKPLWDALYAAGADIVLNADARFYERFAPQRPDGTKDEQYGIREFIVGTGGISNQAPIDPPRANSERIVKDVFGVLVLTLNADSYSWEFRPIAGQTLAQPETGSANCHTSPLPVARPGGPYRSEGTVQFDGRTSSDPQGETPLTYEWDFGDGATLTGSGADDATPAHTYAADGEYTVSLTITDATGDRSETATTTATIGNIAPTVNAGPDQWANPAASVTVRGHFGDPGANDGAWSYKIDWGDGSSQDAGTTPTQDDPVNGTHPYSAAGEYLVTLTVTDKDDASASDQLKVTVSDASAPSQVFVGAGDIAECTPAQDDEKTAKLLDGIPGTVFTVGDNAYPDGTTEQYRDCYDPTWGRHKSRTYATLGNHEYDTPDAGPSFDYFGPSIGPRGKGYYSFDLGAWHIVVLNNYVPFAAGSPQHDWLKADLASSNKRCTIALWHEPRFFSPTTVGAAGLLPKLKVLWDELYARGVELVLNGHTHHYERFRAQTPDGEADDERGIREFIIGTGGSSTAMPVEIRQNSERVGDTFGVLKLTLEPDKYTWEFVPIEGKTFTDAGSGTCHDPKPEGPKVVSVGMSSLINPSIYGDEITITAKVTSDGSAVSEGTVSFFDGGTCENPDATLAGPQPVDANGEASFNGTSLSAADSPHAVLGCYDGTASYQDGSGSLTQTVDKASQSITFAQLADKGYSNPDFDVSATASSGLAVGFDAAGDCTVSAKTVSLTRIGACTLTAAQPGDGNYLAATSVDRSFNITKGALTVAADNQARMYGDPNPPLTGTLTGVKSGDNIGATYSTPATLSSSVGDHPIEPTLSDPDSKLPNYAVTSNNGTLTITQAQLSVKADNKARPYGEDNPALTGVLEGVRNNDNITAEFSTEASKSSPAGDYVITATLKDPDGKLPNYDVTSANGVLSVGKAGQTITFDALADKTYGDPDFPVRATANSGLPVRFAASGGCSVTETTVAITGAQSCTITASQSGDANYGPADDVAHTFAVGKAALMATADSKERAYGAANPPLTGSLSGVRNGDNITATYSTAATEASAAGSYSIEPTLSDPDTRLANYDVSSTNGALTVAKAPLTVRADNKARAYNEQNPPLTGTVDGVRNSDDITASYGTTASPESPAGAYEITATLSDPDGRLGNYAMKSANGVLTVGKAAQSITFDELNGRGYGDPAFDVNATANSGLPVTFAASGDCTISGATVTITRAGSCAVTASQVGNSNYEPAADVIRTFDIAKAQLTVTANNESRSYGDANPTLTGSISGVKNGDNIGATFNTTATDASPVGSYAITSTLSDPDDKLANYSVEQANGTLTVTQAELTVTADDKSREYGDANPAFTGSLSGVQNGDNITASFTAAATPSSPVGAYAIEPALSDPEAKLGNYSVTSTNGALTVGKAALAVTADDKERIYAAANPTLTGTVSGIQNGDDITASFSTIGGEGSVVGTYAITSALNDPSGKLGNYDVTQTDGILAIGAATLTVTADSKSRLYGQPNPSLTGSVSGIRNNDDITASYTTASTVESAVGTYPITSTLSDPAQKLGNYEVTSVDGALTVGKAALTVTADDQSRTYGAANPPLSGTLSGVREGDIITASYGTTATETNAVGTYAIAATLHDPGGKLSNYDVASTDGTLTVARATLTVEADDKTRTYGEENPPLTGTMTGVQNGDNITASYATGATASTPVGQYAITSTLSDADGKLDNYDVHSTDGVLSVTKAALAVTADDQARAYGDANPALTGSISGIKNGDDITASYSTSATKTSAAATYSIEPGLSDRDNKLPNYDVTSTNGTLTVTKGALTAMADDKERLYGEANPVLTGTLTGVKNADNITVAYSTTAESSSPVGSYAIPQTLNDPDGKLGNYDVTYVNGTLTVTKAGLTVQADDKSRAYGDANPDLTGTLEGARNGDNIAASYSTAATGSSPVGDYAITSSLSDPDGKLGNYTVNSTDGVLTIVAKDQTITFNALSEKTFTDPAFEITAEASSGLKVDFLTTSDRCTVGSSTLTGTVSKSTVKLKDVGIGASGCAITARQNGNGSYNPATDQMRGFDVLNRIDALPAPPGMNPNNDLSWGSSQNREFPVAILTLKNADGTVTFDASRADPKTITLTGPTGKAVPVATDSKGQIRAYSRDVDGDFDQDLQLYFVRAEVFASTHVNGTHPVVLNGNLKIDRPDGRPIRGRDKIRLIP